MKKSKYTYKERGTLILGDTFQKRCGSPVVSLLLLSQLSVEILSVYRWVAHQLLFSSVAQNSPHPINPSVTFFKDKEKDKRIRFQAWIRCFCFLLAGLIPYITYSYKVCLTYLLTVPSTALQQKLSLSYREVGLTPYKYSSWTWASDCGIKCIAKGISIKTKKSKKTFGSLDSNLEFSGSRDFKSGLVTPFPWS